MAAYVRALLRNSTLKPGQRLPSIRALALALDVAPGTVQTAYRLLQGQGVITRDAVSSGFSVVDDASLGESDAKVIAGEVRDLVARLSCKGFDESTIRAAIIHEVRKIAKPPGDRRPR